MKNTLSPKKVNPSDVAYLDESEPLESIIEDLGQQDVLPLDMGSVDLPQDNLSGGLDESGRWDEPIGSHGVRAERLSLEDETNSAVELVSDGLNEAEEELRDLDEEQEEEMRDEEN